MAETPPVSRALEALGIAHEVLRHAGVVTSLEQAARERGQRPGQVVRSIVFRLGAERFMMVLAAGPSRFSWKKLRQYVGQTRLTVAREAEVLGATGHCLGTVAPFGLPRSLRIPIDRQVVRETQISIGSGAANTDVLLSSADPVRAIPHAELVDLAAT